MQVSERALGGSASDKRHALGQSLTEFAMILPVMMLLTLIALDFGRVYLGYINLQNMARIAANFAANNPDAWGGTPNAAIQTKYGNQILADAAKTNCILPKIAGVTQVPTPSFTDTNGDGKTNGLGDTARVQISCTFGVVTPIISSILGGGVAVSAESSFPVKSGESAFSGGGGGLAPSASFTANGVASGPGVTLAGVGSLSVAFQDTSGGSPTSWSWDFGNGASSTAQNPGTIVYATPGSYAVTETAININGTSTSTMTIQVVAPSTVDFTATPTSGNAGMIVTFTSTSTAGGTSFAWNFGTGEGAGTGSTASHTYSVAGTYTVSLTVTYPAPTGTLSVTKANLIVVAPLCTVPSLTGRQINVEETKNGWWAGNGFNPVNLSVGPGTPIAKNNSWTIQSQTLTSGSKAPCSSSIQVNDH